MYPATLSTSDVPTKRRRPNTTARLLDAAFEVFAERGIHGASVEQICERAGFTRGAFYSNYKSKDELFLALFDHRHAQTLEQVRRLTAVPDPAVAVTNVINFFMEPDDEQRNWFLISTEFTLHAIRNPEAGKILAQHDRALREAFIPLIEQVFARAGREPGISPDRIARVIVALSEGSAAQSFVEPDTLPPGTLEREFFPLLFQAIASTAPNE
jgi:AcrR family transcriptional regulator